MPLHPNYMCKHEVPTPLIDHEGNDSGLCKSCELIYDERLYYMQLRKHMPNLPEGEEDLDVILRTIDPERYRLVTGQPA